MGSDCGNEAKAPPAHFLFAASSFCLYIFSASLRIVSETSLLAERFFRSCDQQVLHQTETEVERSTRIRHQVPHDFVILHKAALQRNLAQARLPAHSSGWQISPLRRRRASGLRARRAPPPWSHHESGWNVLPCCLSRPAECGPSRRGVNLLKRVLALWRSRRFGRYCGSSRRSADAGADGSTAGLL